MIFLKTYFFPANSGNSPSTTAARPVAPAPSTTAFSNSSSLSIDKAIFSSLKQHYKNMPIQIYMYRKFHLKNLKIFR